MDAYAEYKALPGSSSALDETAENIEDALKARTEHALVGWVARSAIACVRYRLNDGVYFYRLAVRKEWQGYGVAKSMLSHLETVAMAGAQPRIWCKVRYSVPRNV